MKRAVQQTLIESSRAAILDGGIQEYNFSQHPFSDDEEVPTLVDRVRSLGLIPWPLVVEEANLGATQNALEK